MPSMVPARPRLTPSGFQRLREAARELGFDDLGAAPAGDLAALRAEALSGSPPETGIEDWLARGRHGEMGWMEHTARLRADPRAWWPDARTVLVGLVSHDGRGEPGDDGASGRETSDDPGGDVPRGRVSRYAWGRDYHLVLKKMLVALGRVLADESRGAAFRTSIDMHPTMEKPLAVLAGLGWIGKHGNLLRRRGSSWFFIGLLLTDAELDLFDPFTAEHCGTCTACLDACPTDAIVSPQVVDARRCISYLTIELSGASEPALREPTGQWVFGCDACQDACPWNRHRSREGHERFAPGPLGRGPALRSLLALDERAFTEATPKSAIKRAKRGGLVRNAATAAGNSGDRALAEPLAELLARDESHAVRAHAAWALGRLGGAAARRALEAARADPSAEVRDEVGSALEAFETA